MHDLARRVEKLEAAAGQDERVLIVGANAAEIDHQLAVRGLARSKVVAFVTGVPRSGAMSWDGADA